MDYICLHDKDEIAQFLNKNTFLHIYSLGDLDSFFWPHTIWYGLRSSGYLTAVALLYIGMPLPTLIALSQDHGKMIKLLTNIRHILPARFYAHLSPGVEIALDPTHNLTSHSEHYKMALLDKTLVTDIDCSDVKHLSMKEITSIKNLYKVSYPGNWFDPRMLETNKYFGIWKEKRLVSVAGIHVYSPQYKVAALGNITTLPTHRKKGYGKQVTARLCQTLIDEGIHVGLNVKTNNDAAISCYEKIGFKIVASYAEFLFQKKEQRADS